MAGAGMGWGGGVEGVGMWGGGAFIFRYHSRRSISAVGVLLCLGIRLSSAVEFSLVKHLFPTC